MSVEPRTAPTHPPATILTAPHWQEHQHRHHERVAERVRGHQKRRQAGVKHPIEDFLWVYYHYSPTRLARWHPGLGVGLLDPGQTDFGPYHCAQPHSAGPVTTVDVPAWWAQFAPRIRRAYTIASATLTRQPIWHCFGRHEWAMIYQTGGQRRHEQLPLRLPPAEIDQVVQAQPLRCSHFDAFRFFTPEARPLNRNQLSRENQPDFEQPGCLHAGMDLYRLAYQMAPVTSAEFIVDCFDFARAARLLDMQASPYDLSAYELEPVPIETTTGRQEYSARQRELSAQGQKLRRQLLTVLEQAVPQLAAQDS